jgi:hypothetical protein
MSAPTSLLANTSSTGSGLCLAAIAFVTAIPSV